MQRWEMLEYVKQILTKVSFNKTLFEKELLKSSKSLLPEELSQLREWCYTNFSNEYMEIIERFFSNF